MSREEFWLGVCVYILIIVSGFSGTIMKKLEILAWDKPNLKLISGYFQPFPQLSVIVTHKNTILISGVWPQKVSSQKPSFVVLNGTANGQFRNEPGKRIIPNPLGSRSGNVPAKSPTLFLGSKPIMKKPSPLPEGKMTLEAEPSKG